MLAIPTNIRVDDRLVLASGFVLLDVNGVLTIDVANLRLELVFADDDKEELGVEPEPISPTALRIRLKNFKSVLGSVFGPAEIGTVGGKALSLALHVSAIGERRATSYCLMTR